MPCSQWAPCHHNLSIPMTDEQREAYEDRANTQRKLIESQREYIEVLEARPPKTIVTNNTDIVIMAALFGFGIGLMSGFLINTFFQ